MKKKEGKKNMKALHLIAAIICGIIVTVCCWIHNGLWMVPVIVIAATVGIIEFVNWGWDEK